MASGEPASTAIVPATGDPTVILAAGHPIGGYILTGRILGRGGFGTVYEARHAQLDRRVAIKVQGGAVQLLGAEARLLDEARLVARLRHPHIVDLFDVGALPDHRVYLVMELLEGTTLHEHLSSVRRLPLGVALPILRGLASALDVIHANGFAHRDVKPANVMLVRSDDGTLQAKLLDFGIAKALDPGPTGTAMTAPGMMIGTPPYMSPEQCLGDPVVPASDIYALGVVAYRILTGALPFGGSAVDIYHAHVYTDPPRPSATFTELDPTLDGPLLAMLAKPVDARPRSASAAIAALETTGAQIEIEIVTRPARPARPARIVAPSTLSEPTASPPRTPARPRRAIWIALVELLALAGIAVAVRVRSEPPPSSPVVQAPVPSVRSSAPVAVPADAPAAAVAPTPVPPILDRAATGSDHLAPHPTSGSRPHPAGKKPDHKDDLEELPAAYTPHDPSRAP